MTFRQAGSGLLFASILVSFAVAVLGRIALGQWNWRIALVFAFGVAVGLFHYVLRRLELRDESRDDEEEINRIMHYAARGDEIKPPPQSPRRCVPSGCDRSAFALAVLARLGPAPAASRGSPLATDSALASQRQSSSPPSRSILAAYFEQNRMGLTHELGDWLIVAMVLNVALAAFVQWFTEKCAFGVHYRQFRRMLAILLLAYENLCKGPDPAEARKLLKRLGREALAEHADWLLVHRDRPIELPKLEL